MQYTTKDIKIALGKAFHKTSNYKLANSVSIPGQLKEGWEVVGTLPDFTTDQNGTVTILEHKEDNYV